MTADKKKKPAENAGSDFPALRDFFSSYLHQDFCDEYGSVGGAAKAFRKDASDDEIRAVQNEWKRWRAVLGNSSVEEIAKVLRRLGSAWQPQSSNDMDLLEKAIGGRSRHD